MMDTGTILVGVALLVGTVVYVARPLFLRPSERSPERSTDAHSHAQLTKRRDALYALIRELDADHQTGKINDEDYQALRERYVAEGVNILKQLDALSSGDSRAALEARIEAQVLALREARSTATGADQEPATRFCTQCGHPVDPEDRFCAQCGAPLRELTPQ
jgi:hypothetical protein